MLINRQNPIIYFLSVVFSFSAIMLIFSTCKKADVDTQAPNITVLQPTDSASFARGDDFLVVTIMNDFVSLHSYRYTMNWLDDPSNISDNPNDSTWVLDETRSIDGDDNRQNVSWKITVPANVRTGFYEFNIYCYDDEGNVGTHNGLIMVAD